MKSEVFSQSAIDYERIEKAIKYLEENFHAQPGLKEIAAHINMSEFHFQRLFSRWVGISPKRFLQFLTKEYAKIPFLLLFHATGLSAKMRILGITAAVRPARRPF